MARTRSSRWIQGMNWVPSPKRPPSPILKGGSIFSRLPPPTSSTRPMRSRATRTPKSAASRATSSQRLQSRWANSSWGGVSSVTSRSP